MNHSSRWIRPLVAVATVLIGFAGCSSSSKSTSTATTTPATSASAARSSGSLAIKNFSFSPTPLTVKVGGSVTITNNDTTDHTVTDSRRAFDTGHITPGSSQTITITKAGTYDYHCNIHQFMKGVIRAGP